MNDVLEPLLKRAVRRILAPVIRLLMEYGVPAPWLQEEVKQAYFHEAVRKAGPGGKVADSRITLMTGIHRRDVKRIRETGASKPSRSIPPILGLQSLWKSEWVDQKGRLRPIPRRDKADGIPVTFFELATQATGGNIAAATFFSDCIDRGVIEHDEESDEVRWIRETGELDDDITDQLEFFTIHNGDHMEASVSNLLADGSSPFFDRALVYENLAVEDAEAIEEMARKKAMKLLLELDAEITRRAESGRTGDHQITFGSFFFNQAHLQAKS